MDVLNGFAMLGVIAAVYFLPTIIAFNRHVPSAWSVAVVNLFFGWTLIGWVVALAMSARTVPQQHLVELETRREQRQTRREQPQMPVRVRSGRYPAWWR